MRLSEEIFKKEPFPSVKGSLFNNDSGYDKAAVEIFLEDVAVNVEKLENENERLLEQIRGLLEEKELRGETTSFSTHTTTNTPTGEIHTDEESDSVTQMKEEIKKKLKKLETLERSTKRILFLAGEDANTITEEAKTDALRVLTEAQEKAESLIREANNRFTEREREIHILNSKAEELKERLKNVAQFIEDAVS